MKIRVGGDGAARHFVKRDVFRRQIRGAGHDHRAAYAAGVLQRPSQRLHAAQTTAHHGGQSPNAQLVEQARLRVHPIFHSHHRKIRAIDLPLCAIGVDVHGAGGAKARAQVVHADDKKAIRVHWFARPDHAVPPAFGFGLIGIHAGHMVRSVERVANQHRIGSVRVERAVRFKRQVVGADGCAAA